MADKAPSSVQAYTLGTKIFHAKDAQGNEVGTLKVTDANKNGIWDNNDSFNCTGDCSTIFASNTFKDVVGKGYKGDVAGAPNPGLGYVPLTDNKIPTNLKNSDNYNLGSLMTNLPQSGQAGSQPTGSASVTTPSTSPETRNLFDFGSGANAADTLLKKYSGAAAWAGMAGVSGAPMAPSMVLGALFNDIWNMSGAKAPGTGFGTGAGTGTGAGGVGTGTGAGTTTGITVSVEQDADDLATAIEQPPAPPTKKGEKGGKGGKSGKAGKAEGSGSSSKLAANAAYAQYKADQAEPLVKGATWLKEKVTPKKESDRGILYNIADAIQGVTLAPAVEAQVQQLDLYAELDKPRKEAEATEKAKAEAEKAVQQAKTNLAAKEAKLVITMKGKDANAAETVTIEVAAAQKALAEAEKKAQAIK